MKKHPKPAKFNKKQRGKPRPEGRARTTKPAGKHPRSASRNAPKGARATRPQKDSQFTPKLTHAQQNKAERAKRKEESLLGKLIIQQELKKAAPDFKKVREYLGKIKSRGVRQRLRDQAARLERSAAAGQ